MIKKIVIASALALMASASFAQTVPHVYAGVDVGTSKHDDFDDRETSAGAFVGYQFTPQIALEGGFRRLYDGDDASIDQIALSVLGSIPMNEQFSVYGRLGYNRLNAESTFAGVTYKENESKVLYGAGVSYNFSPTIAGRVEVQRPYKDVTNFSAGIAFKF